MHLIIKLILNMFNAIIFSIGAHCNGFVPLCDFLNPGWNNTARTHARMHTYTN